MNRYTDMILIPVVVLVFAGCAVFMDRSHHQNGNDELKTAVLLLAEKTWCPPADSEDGAFIRASGWPQADSVASLALSNCLPGSTIFRITTIDTNESVEHLFNTQYAIVVDEADHMTTVSSDDEAAKILSKKRKMLTIDDTILMIKAFCDLRSYWLKYEKVGGMKSFVEDLAAIPWGLHVTKKGDDWNCNFTVACSRTCRPVFLLHILIDSNGTMRVVSNSKILYQSLAY